MTNAHPLALTFQGRLDRVRVRSRSVAGVSLIGAGGGALLIAGSLLPWLTFYAGLSDVRGIDGRNGIALISTGALIIIAALVNAVRPSGGVGWALAAAGFAGAGIGFWALAQGLGILRQLGADPFVQAGLGPGLPIAVVGGALALSTLLINPSGARSKADRVSAGVPLHVLLISAAGACTVGASLIHFAAIGEHQSESALFAIFFVASGVAQMLAAAAMAIRPQSRVIAMVAALNLGIVAGWAISRTSGMPFGPNPWKAEAIGVPDVLCTGLELMAVAALTWVRLSGARARVLLNGAALPARVAGVVFVIATTAVAVGAQVTS